MIRRVVGPAATAAALLAACAQPPAPRSTTDVVAEPGSASDEAVAARRRAAVEYEKAGDWYAAVTQWHVATLLAPDDRVLARQLEAARTAQRRTAADALRAARTANARGDVDEAGRQCLRALAVDPDQADAAALLREIESRKIARIQAERAARVRRNETIASEGTANRGTDDARAIDLELAVARFSADNERGLAEMQRYVAANPADAGGRGRLATTVIDAARKAEADGKPERALALYRQVPALAGGAIDGVDARVAVLRRSLAADYNARAQRASASSLPQAIRYWEQALAFDPNNASIAYELDRARQLQRKLDRLPNDGAGH